MSYVLNKNSQIRKDLERLIRRSKSQACQVFRAKIICLSMDGKHIPEICEVLGTSPPTVRKWIGRFNTNPDVAALKDADRSGRPHIVPSVIKCEVMKLACSDIRMQAPHLGNIWTIKSLQEWVRKTTGFSLSRSEISRILNKGELRPHRVKVWLHSPDPRFQQKVEVISRLYMEPPLGAVILCIDEKSGMQAIERRRSVASKSRGCVLRVDHEYKRHGTQSLIASFDVKTGQVFGRCGRTRKKEDLAQFMNELARRYPTQEVFIIWDNLNIHQGYCWNAYNREHGNRFHFVYTPVHGSWINQIEIWFGILQRKALKNGSFKSEEELRQSVLGFIEEWNTKERHPFKWQFRGYIKQTA